LTDPSHLQTRPRYWWDNSVHKISAQSNVIVKSYRINGRTAGRTHWPILVVYSLFEYTKRSQNAQKLYPETTVPRYVICLRWLVVLGFPRYLVSKLLKKIIEWKNPNSIATNIDELLWKYWCLYLSYISHRSMRLLTTVNPLDTNTNPFKNNSF
jgi:hypothetical protein